MICLYVASTRTNCPLIDGYIPPRRPTLVGAISLKSVSIVQLDNKIAIPSTLTPIYKSHSKLRNTAVGEYTNQLEHPLCTEDRVTEFAPIVTGTFALAIEHPTQRAPLFLSTNCRVVPACCARCILAVDRHIRVELYGRAISMAGRTEIRTPRRLCQMPDHVACSQCRDRRNLIWTVMNLQTNSQVAKHYINDTKNRC